MPVTFVGIGALTSATAGPGSVALPAGLQAGDFLVLHVLITDDPVALPVTGPTGWDLEAQMTGPSENQSVWTRAWQSGDPNPSLSMPNDPIRSWYGRVSAWRGVDLVNGPYDPAGVQARNSTGGAFIDALPFNVSTAHPLLAHFTGDDDDTVWLTVDQGTSIYANSTTAGDDRSFAAWYVDGPSSPGSTGTSSYDIDGNRTMGVITLPFLGVPVGGWYVGGSTMGVGL